MPAHRFMPRRVPARSSLVAALALAGASCSRHASAPGGADSGIAPTAAIVRPGEKVQFQSSFLPAVTWQIVEGHGYGLVSDAGEYQAPYARPAAGAATVRASAGERHADARIQFVEGSPDSGACSADGHYPTFGDYVYVEELPDAVYRAAPSYPEAARIAGVEGTVFVQALVCTSGLVMETRVVVSIPLLDAAAVDAVRHWEFKPALSNGKPVAVWVGIPVRFTLH